MRKKYLQLTEEQKTRNVIFSSQLMPNENPTIHEVFKNDKNKDITIKRLKDDKFFNTSHWNYNLIRE